MKPQTTILNQNTLLKQNKDLSTEIRRLNNSLINFIVSENYDSNSDYFKTNLKRHSELLNEIQEVRSKLNKLEYVT